ncbi:CRISPR-associated protein, Cmr3 family [Caloranaerobacter azorensis DSM 13643]|uniref:CRISPR-associated protein, Cmr3 family n=1 Tax=Caloranaerobacter azorensis DSM 13643 TaxID=1121264 RepID=A0A1M5UHR5_9FIRM|nr:type III-B CRISPR module-associated Cmr3 family protein [Caloranaerobacter azorensis]SHH62203.1 CRISPR-associated protein, Cmr3 family [Caloranaerobacter azorensis DSM 13643]
MSKYLVTLKPLDYYFFGGEITFDSKDGTTNYFVRSNIFPQQTAILGALRKEILIQQGLYKYDWSYTDKERENINKIIGKESFKINYIEEQDFGVIKSISNVFIYKNGEFFISAPFDHNEKVCKEINRKKYYTPFKFEKETFKSNICLNGVYKLIGYDHKKGITRDFLNIETKEIVSENKIFVSKIRIGIKKGSHITKDDGGYYKQQFFKLEDGYEFAFILELSSDIHIKDCILYIGGEKSAFRAKFEKKTDNFEIKVEFDDKYRTIDRVILLSDTYLDNPYENCGFAIADTENFRNIETCYEKGINNINKALKKISKKYKFLKRGTVLYSIDLKELEERIEKYENLRKIGYNKYVYIKGGI